MFGWFKKQAQINDFAAIASIACVAWKECVEETGAEFGVDYREPMFWSDVMSRFQKRWVAFHPGSAELLSIRCPMFLELLSEFAIRGFPALLSPEEMEQLGEFVAVAIVRDLRQAILASPERAALIIDVIPPEWREIAGITMEEFSELHLHRTGKRHVRRY